MSNTYQYDEMKPWVLTDEGQRVLLKVRDLASALLKASGAIKADILYLHAIKHGSGDSWTAMTYVERLIELGELVEVCPGHRVPWQNRVFIAGGGLG